MIELSSDADEEEEEGGVEKAPPDEAAATSRSNSRCSARGSLGGPGRDAGGLGADEEVEGDVAKARRTVRVVDGRTTARVDESMVGEDLRCNPLRLSAL